MNNYKSGRISLILLLIAISVTFLAVGTDAQTTRRKNRPKPLATPIPVYSGAEIISRSGEYTAPEDETEPVETPAADVTALPKAGSERTKKPLRKIDYDEKQKRMLLNLDILTRAEQRSESLRKQLFDMIEKENTVKSRLDQIETDIRPESIERSLQLSGSMKPEEVRNNRRRSLEAERNNLQLLLTEIQTTKSNHTNSLSRSDTMVDRLRAKLEKDINDSFLNDDEDGQ